ncbi:MAG: hypothetical protein ACOCU6_01540 [Nanoarchaeota archaeon]
MTMKFFNKKGQAALEFLTTYGWAFLIILVMIGGLSYFGVLDVSQFVPDSCKLDGNIECSSYALQSDGLQLEIKNNLPQADINITKVRVKETTEEKWCNSTDLAGDSINPRSSEEVNASIAPDHCNMDDYIDDKKKFDLRVYYTKDDSTIEQMAVGSMTTTVRE